MAELLLYVTDERRPETAFQDGDILCAFNERRILCTHAQHICHPRRAARNASGLIFANALSHRWYELTHQYRFERVSATEVRRTVIATGDSEVFGPRPNEKGEAIDVRLYVRRRRLKADCVMFGEDGAEIWYGGRKDHSAATVSAAWDEIESRTALERADHADARWLSGGLRLRVDEFDDAESAALTESEYDNTDPEKPILTKKRTHLVDWRTFFPRQIGGVNYTARTVTGKYGQVRFQREGPFTRSTLIETK